MHLLLEAMHLLLIASCYAFLLLLVRPGAPSSVLVPSSKAPVTTSKNMYFIAICPFSSDIYIHFLFSPKNDCKEQGHQDYDPTYFETFSQICSLSLPHIPEYIVHPTSGALK